jgi:hypothetical protein
VPGEVLNVFEGHVLIEEIGHDLGPEAARGKEVRKARIGKTPIPSSPAASRYSRSRAKIGENG